MHFVYSIVEERAKRKCVTVSVQDFRTFIFLKFENSFDDVTKVNLMCLVCPTLQSEDLDTPFSDLSTALQNRLLAPIKEAITAACHPNLIRGARSSYPDPEVSCVCIYILSHELQHSTLFRTVCLSICLPLCLCVCLSPSLTCAHIHVHPPMFTSPFLKDLSLSLIRLFYRNVRI